MADPRENFVALIQARMTSRRLPGKVLKPLAGRAILEHLYAAATTVLPTHHVHVATSKEVADDEIERFCMARGIRVYRGPLDDVTARLQGALKASGAKAFFRICADSPFYDPAAMMRAMEVYAAKECDLVTNVFPRSFPKGRSVELARASTFLALDTGKLTSDEREHVFQHYYANPEKFRIENFSAGSDFTTVNLCIDTPAEWERAQRFLQTRNGSSHQFTNEELATVFTEKSK